MERTHLRWLAIALPLAVCACRARTEAQPAPAQAPVRVASVDLGREVDLDKRVRAPQEKFAPGDTIYASVLTEGDAPVVALTARWRKDGQLLDETTQMIAPEGETASEFHVWKPQGWPSGEYEVEILVDGTSSVRRRFSVD